MTKSVAGFASVLAFGCFGAISSTEAAPLAAASVTMLMGHGLIETAANVPNVASSQNVNTAVVYRIPKQLPFNPPPRIGATPPRSR